MNWQTLLRAVRIALSLSFVLCLRTVAAQSAPPEKPACATAGYVVAFQGIGGSSATFDPRWEQPLRSSGGSFLVDENPVRVYEGPETWGRVTVVKWSCFEAAEAAWRSLPTPAPADRPALLHAAALYRGSSYPPFPDSMLRLPPGCTAPAYFMAMNTTRDQAKYDVYRQAMRNTDYVQRLGSTTLFSGDPVATTGDWPAQTAASMTRWPCAEAFHLFYFDPTYVDTIKPLRAGAIDYRILGFANADRPR